MKNQQDLINTEILKNSQKQDANSNVNLQNRISSVNNANAGMYNDNLASNSGIHKDNSRASSDSQEKKERNNASNADAVKTAANIASKSGHPVVAGIGKGIQAADKLTGGKLSDKLGKGLSLANKVAPGGRFTQALTNRAAKNGTMDKINEANSKRNNSLDRQSGKFSPKKSNFKNLFSSGSESSNSKSKKREIEESYDDGKESFKITYKVALTVAILAMPVFLVVIFMVLLVSGSQVFLQANGLGHADEVRSSDAEKNIKKVKDDKLDTEITDDDLSYKTDIYITEDEVNINYEFVDEKYRNNQEASLSELADFYPEIVNYTTDEYNQNDVYKFFMKLYHIYNYYLGQGVRLDMPLIMSVLNLQSSDMSIVFKANTTEYTKEDIELGTSNPDFDVKKDWSSYKSTRNNSAHDIEVLAQAMVKEGTSKSGSSNRTVSKTGKEAIDKMTEIALQQADEVHSGGQKYWSWYGFNYRDEWCAMFVSWLFNQIGGLNKYIKSSAVAGAIPRESVAAGYGTWYEDECTDPSTVPQPGDVIVFDPHYNGTYTPYPQNHHDKYYSSHVGYVYKVDDTYVYTVEGNSGDSVKDKKYERKTHCNKVGVQGINGYFRPNY